MESAPSGPRLGDVQFGVEDLNLGVCLDVTGGDFTLACRFDIDGLRSVAMQACNDTLHIQHDLRDVFLDTGDRRKLVLHTGDPDGRRGITGAVKRAALCAESYPGSCRSHAPKARRRTFRRKCRPGIPGIRCAAFQFQSFRLNLLTVLLRHCGAADVSLPIEGLFITWNTARR